MSAEIYYFSGTGNSLAVAKDIAARINSKLISIASVMDHESIVTDADTIGIVFPVYFGAVLGGIPLIVRRFIGKIQNINLKTIVAVSTYGFGRPDFQVLQELLREQGGKLASGFAVKMPFYYLPLCGFGKIKIQKQNKLFNHWKRKLEIISEAIVSKKEGVFESIPFLIKAILVPPGKSYYYSSLKKMTGMDLPLEELILWMDLSFQLNDKCDGCGICSRVCPVNNISIAGGKPSWRHHCEHCCACIQWCPEGAIDCKGFSSNGNGVSIKSHHPDIKLSQML